MNEFLSSKIEKISEKDVWFNLIEESKYFAVYFMKKNWLLALSEKEFYISDNPVSIVNNINRNTVRGTLGIDSYGIEISIPLSDSIVLFLYCEKAFHDINNLIVQCTSENILNINSLQVKYSNRFTFFSSNDFSLAIDMLNEDPSLADDYDDVQIT